MSSKNRRSDSFNFSMELKHRTPNNTPNKRRFLPKVIREESVKKTRKRHVTSFFLTKSLNEVMGGTVEEKKESSIEEDNKWIPRLNYLANHLGIGRKTFLQFISDPMDHDETWRTFVYGNVQGVKINETSSTKIEENDMSCVMKAKELSQTDDEDMLEEIIETIEDELLQPSSSYSRDTSFGRRVGPEVFHNYWRQFVYSSPEKSITPLPWEMFIYHSEKTVNKTFVSEVERAHKYFPFNILPNETTESSPKRFQNEQFKSNNFALYNSQSDAYPDRQLVFGANAHKQLNLLKRWQCPNKMKNSTVTMPTYDGSAVSVDLLKGMKEDEPWWYCNTAKCFCDETCEYCSQFFNISSFDIDDAFRSHTTLGSRYPNDSFPKEVEPISTEALHSWLEFSKKKNLMTIRPLLQKSQKVHRRTLPNKHLCMPDIGSKDLAEKVTYSQLVRSNLNEQPSKFSAVEQSLQDVRTWQTKRHQPPSKRLMKDFFFNKINATQTEHVLIPDSKPTIRQLIALRPSTSRDDDEMLRNARLSVSLKKDVPDVYEDADSSKFMLPNSDQNYTVRLPTSKKLESCFDLPNVNDMKSLRSFRNRSRIQRLGTLNALSQYYNGSMSKNMSRIGAVVPIAPNGKKKVLVESIATYRKLP
ncbi:hypothetical protein SNEBB_004618 [Seison nebaliae]|nr:hypothetical protein SNEBB_004618 [Seison nebaliae]